MPDPSEAPRPPLIIPGAEAEPASPSRIILPGGEPASPEAPDAPRPSIVLPPGADAPEDVPEYPRLRPLVLLPVRDGTRELLLVSDPMGIVLGQPVLSIETLPILQLLDGTTALSDITAAIMRESKDLRIAGAVRDFIGQLDQMLLLDSPRFQQALQAMRDAYHPLEIRPAALEDRSYPADPTELETELDAHVAAGVAMRDEASQPTAAATAVPRAILAPHLDPRRAGAVIARAYLDLGAQPAAPVRVVVFGTGHSLMGDLVALTRKHFQTPLGIAPCDTAFVDRVAARLADFAYRGELAHREEHSIEFQVLYLQHRLRGRAFTIVPILCGGFHTLLDDQLTPRESPEFETMIDAVREAETALGGTTLYVAGIDLSHVGPRFGDPPIDARVKQETEAVDRAALDAALAGDADAWFNAIASQDDRTRICGFAPAYAMLRCVDLRNGRLLKYQQCDDPDGSMVSVAAAVWDRN